MCIFAYIFPVGSRVLGQLALLGEEVGGDDVVTLVLVDDAKVSDGGARLAVETSSKRWNNELAGLDEAKGCLEEGGRVAVAELAKIVWRIAGEGAHDAVRRDRWVGFACRDKPKRLGIRAEPESNNGVGRQAGNNGRHSGGRALVNLGGSEE